MLAVCSTEGAKTLVSGEAVLGASGPSTKRSHGKAGMSVIARAFEGRRRSDSLLRAITIYHVAAVAVFMGILCLAILPRFDTDVWWHLFTGRRILDGAGVPTRDFLSFTARSHTWIDHEWLAEAGMAAILKVGGLRLLGTIFGLVITGAFLIAFLVMRIRGVNQGLALAMTVVAAAATVAGWGPRVQTLSLVFAAAFCFALERYRATAGIEWLIGLVGAMWLWSNLHGGFVVGFMLMGAYLVGGTIDRVHGGMTWSLAVKRQRSLALALVVAFVITFINPNTYRQVAYPLRFLTPNTFTNAIQESQSPNFHLYQQLPFEVMLVGLIACGLMVRRRVSWIDLLLVMGLTHLALQQTRNIALWCIIVTPILAVYVQEAWAPLAERWQHLNRPVERARLMTLNWVALVLLVVGGLTIVSRANSPAQVQAAVDRSFPFGAAAYIEDHRMDGNMFNSYSYGGYLTWRTDARYPVFIDSRADTVFPDQLLRDYQSIYAVGPGWSTLLQKYRIGWVLVENQAPIAAVLSQQNNWKVVFRGRLATIIVVKGDKDA
jgi:hypothetical protein